MRPPTGKTIVVLLLLCFLPAAMAQPEDGTYYAFKTVKSGQQPDVITIRVLSVGNGIRQFTDEVTKKALEGEYHIALGHVRYAIADIKKGLLSGNWTQYLNNEKEETGVFKDGKYDGHRWVSISEGYNESVYKDGKIMTSESWYDNGQLLQKQQYDEDGKLHGEVVGYYRDGTVKSRLTYVHGIKEGPQYTTNQLIETYTLKKGKKVGEYSLMTHGGGLMEKGMLDDEGNKTGTWYYSNGNHYVGREETYVNGKIHGERKRYYSNGALSHYEEYVDGKPHGKTVEYDTSDGKPNREYHYRNGKLHGEFKSWYDGELYISKLYKDGKLVMKKEYHKGKLYEVHLLDETGSLKRIEGYNDAGQRTYRDAAFKKHPSITLKESAAGVIDIVME